MADSLQDIFAGVAQSGPEENAAYALLLQDYTDSKIAFLVGGTIGLGVILTIVWRAGKKLFGKMPAGSGPLSKFERRTYIFFGITGAATALAMLLILAANLSNVISPQNGLAHAVPEMAMPQTDVRRAELQAAVKTWLKSGEERMPAVLQVAVQDRLAWQRPKAAICLILFVALSWLTRIIWKNLIRQSKSNGPKSKIKNMFLIFIGIFLVPLTLLLMIMAIANAQGSYAPIIITTMLG